MDVELYLYLNQGDHIGASITDFKAVKGALLQIKRMLLLFRTIRSIARFINSKKLFLILL